MKRACPQLRTADLVVRYGFTARHWTKLAAQGRIPGARQPCGPRGHWSFDARLFAEWWEAGKREGVQWRTSTSEAKRGGPAPPVRDDLQYIRINGTIVGALVGCAIYPLSAR